MTVHRLVRRVPPVDALDRPEGLLVLTGRELVRLSDLAADVFRWSEAPVPLAALAARLVDAYGAPPEADALEATRVVVDDLAARGVVAWASVPLAVTFVCTGNTCRSAYAEVVARRLAGDDDRLVLASAGTHAWDGGRMCPGMAALAQERGADPTGFRTRAADPAAVADADVLLTAGVEHRDHLLREHPDAAARVFTLAQFADGADLAPSGVTGAELVAWVADHAGVPDPVGDVPDPLTHGAASERACADHLDGLLARIVPRLAGPTTP